MINLTIPPRNTDDRAWEAKLEARRQQARHFQALDHAATVAATRPVKVARTKRTTTATSTKPRTVREPKVATPRPPQIRPCAKCEHPTRPNSWKAADHPGTRPRLRDDMCTTCATRVGRVKTNRYPRVTDAEVETWVAAYQAGTPVLRIARAAGRPAITVSAHLVRVGVKGKAT